MELLVLHEHEKVCHMHYQDALVEAIREAAAYVLAEDVGPGDITAQLIPETQWATARIITREPAVLCGVAWVEEIFRRLDPSVRLHWSAADGDRLETGTCFVELEGPARSLLSGERAALNLLQTLSATATRTRHYVDLLEGTNVRLLDTRKTLPGLRLAQKYAVATGGGLNHRIGLYDGILIKENHIIAAGGIRPAVERARELASEQVFIEVEIEQLAQLDEVLACGVRMILLDNMDLDTMRRAVDIAGDRAELEASGGVHLDTVRAIAETGVHRISIGGLTKDVRAIDLSLRHLED